MENPSTWGPVEKAVSEAMKQHDAARASGVIGASAVKVVAEAARQATLAELRRAAVATAKGDDRLIDYVNALIAAQKTS